MTSSRSNKLTNLILCGGIGARLWPLSRPDLPKQFAHILPGRTLFEQTVLRNREFCSRLAIAANAAQMQLARTQLAGIGITEFSGVVEPVGRNTAPAIALFALGVPEDEIVLVSPSDHVIADTVAYSRAVREAVDCAAAGHLVTFGITPTYAETGFGYIQQGQTIPGSSAWQVVAFREKPDSATAQSYVDSGKYFWNSGMFCFRAGTFLEELRKHAPEVHSACRIAFDGAGLSNGLRVPAVQQMAEIPSVSIDYAVMEHTSLAALVPGNFGWSDLGSFEAVYDFLLKDAQANASTGERTEFQDASGNLVVSAGGRRIVLLDVEDLMIVDTLDALLVTSRGSGQRVKEIKAEAGRLE